MRNYSSRFKAESRFTTRYETETQNRAQNNSETKAILEKEEKEKDKENDDWRSILNKLNASIKQVDSLPKDPPSSPKERKASEVLFGI